MKIYLTKGYSKYGAQMGRDNEPVKGKCYLQKLKMSGCGAYDSGGAYWGIGETLYVCQDSDKNQFFTRAKNRNGAKNIIVRYNKSVTFYV